MEENDFGEPKGDVGHLGDIPRGGTKRDKFFEFSPVDIKQIRKNLHKSQSEFAKMIGVSVSTLQNWEQGRRQPEGPARALLKIAAENPKAVDRALKHLGRPRSQDLEGD